MHHRAVGWYLLSARDKAEMDSKQWKEHCDQLDQELATEKEARQKAQQEYEQQITDFKALVEKLEEGTARLSKELATAEASVGERTASLQGCQKQLAETEERLAKAERDIAERDSKVGSGVSGHSRAQLQRQSS